MRNHKRILSLSLALVMALALLPTGALAAGNNTTNVIALQYEEAWDFSDGLAKVTMAGKQGFIDTKGNEVVPCGKFKAVGSFSEGLAAVQDWDSGKWGFINVSGQMVIPCQYYGVLCFSEGLAAVNVKSGFPGEWGYIDKSGTEVIPCSYVSASNFQCGRAWVLANTFCGYIDTTGKKAFPYERDILAGLTHAFFDGFAADGLSNGEFGYIDVNGKELPCSYHSVRDFSEGLAAVSADSGEKDKQGRSICKWGFIDTTGQEVIPCKYDEVGYFSDGLAAVLLNGKWGFIDTTGKEVIPCQYAGLNMSGVKHSFSEGLAVVKKDGKWGFIDKTGAEIVPCTLTYDAVYPLKCGLARVCKDGKWGFIAINGHTYTPTPSATPTPTPTTPAEGFVTASGDISYDPYSLLKSGVPSRDYDYADARIPVKINEPYIDSDDPATSGGIADDILRISYVVKQETTTCDGEALEVYTIYPDSFFWHAGCPGVTYSVTRTYAATLENGALRKGELIDEYVPDEPSYSARWTAGSDSVGNYYIIEYENTLFSKTLGVHVIEGNQPASAPKYYAQFMGVSQAPGGWREFESFPSACLVPAGTVITSSRNATDYRCVPIDAVSWDIFDDGLDTYSPVVKELPTYSCNGRQCFAVEPGMLYEVWNETLSWDDDQERLYFIGSIYPTFFVADDSVPAVSDGSATIAYASTQTVDVDGKPVEFECYAIKDENGNATNYIKLRDLAMLLNGSAAQFQVGWDGSVTITTKAAYTPNGSELSTPYSGDRAYQETTATTLVNGQAADLAAFVLNDDAGGGYTYYQLRDLGQTLGFNVGWSADKGIFVETDKPYDANN